LVEPLFQFGKESGIAAGTAGVGRDTQALQCAGRLVLAEKLAPGLQRQIGWERGAGQPVTPQVARGAGPRPRFRTTHQSGAHRIHLHVAERAGAIELVQRRSGKSSLPQVPHAPGGAMPIPRVTHMADAERPCEGELGMRDGHVMDVVGHDLLLVIPALRDVIREADEYRTEWTRHNSFTIPSL